MTQSVYRTELTPVSFLERSACVFPDKTAVVHGGRRYTYQQFAERVNRLASALRGAGLAKHDRVGRHDAADRSGQSRVAGNAARMPSRTVTAAFICHIISYTYELVGV